MISGHRIKIIRDMRDMELHGPNGLAGLETIFDDGAPKGAPLHPASIDQ